MANPNMLAELHRPDTMRGRVIKCNRLMILGLPLHKSSGECQ
jgi:hypothetical protein